MCGLKVSSTSHLSSNQLQATEAILPEVVPFQGQPTVGDQPWCDDTGLGLSANLGWAALALELPIELVKVLPSLYLKPTSLSI